MFGLELWFAAAVVSSVGIGVYSYTHKIASMRGYNSALINSYGMGMSSSLLFITALFFDGLQTLTPIMAGVALAAGITFLISSNIRIDALRYLDATVALPIHKVVSPLFAIFLGIILFGEQFSVYEWAGLVFSLLTPILLISRHENGRQKHLIKGLILISLSAMGAAVVAYLNKLGADIFTSVLFYGAVANSLGTVIGVMQYKFRNKNKGGIVEVHHFDGPMLKLVLVGSLAQYVGFSCFLLAFDWGGTLGIVYTINSLYILIPIILSIIFYNEHWNLRKIVAIILSIAALGLLR